MRAWEYTLMVPHRPGSIAALGEVLGNAGINIEAIDCAIHRGQAVVHVVVGDTGTRDILQRFSRVGFELIGEQEVLIEGIEDRPGALAEKAQQIADAGINLISLHVATGSRVVMGAADIDALERAWGALVASGSAS